jgi:hypothetical protein
VLLALGDDLGRRFQELNLHDRDKSPLTARNQSILAHGFEAASEATFRRLWEAGLRLVDVAEEFLPTFPRLGTRPWATPSLGANRRTP